MEKYLVQSKKAIACETSAEAIRVAKRTNAETITVEIFDNNKYIGEYDMTIEEFIREYE